STATPSTRKRARSGPPAGCARSPRWAAASSRTPSTTSWPSPPPPSPTAGSPRPSTPAATASTSTSRRRSGTSTTPCAPRPPWPPASAASVASSSWAMSSCPTRARTVLRGAAVALAVSLLGGLAAVPAARGEPGPNPVLRWNDALLEAIRVTKTPPTIGARALAVTNTCMYDAWAAYDPVAVGTRLGGTLRRPAEERTPAGVALQACRAVLDFRHPDGANQLGDEPGSAGGPYSDYTGYRPVNGPDRLSDPDRWQPRRTPDGQGGTTVQRFLTPQWGRVVPFAPGDADETGGEGTGPVGGGTAVDFLAADPGPPRSGTPARQAEVDEMVRLSAGLTDEQKVIAEYWADGAGSELPSGHWMRFAQFCSRRDALGVDSDVKLSFLLANAMLDAGIATWARKVRFDSIRPASLVPHVEAGKAIRAWAGPYQGTREMDGAAWRPYLPTPAFAEYPSGHSTFSAAGAEVLDLFTGRTAFGATVVVPAGASHVEPGAVPARDVVLHWDSFDDAADQAGFSRRLGGIHFLTGDLDGRLVGRRVAARVVARGRELFTGR